MDDFYQAHYSKCMDDHEGRLRKIEANNKEQAKLYYEREKLDMKIDSLAKLIDTRLDSIENAANLRVAPIEKWMESRIIQIGIERSNKKENKSDIYAIIAVVISMISVIVLLINLYRG